MSLWLYVNDAPVGYVDYDLTTGSDGNPRVTISWMRSMVEGKGYARALMEYLYAAHPSADVDWGICQHPASLALAADFYERYFSRTEYAEPSEV